MDRKKETEINQYNYLSSPFVVSVNGFGYFIFTLILGVIGYLILTAISSNNIDYDAVRTCTLISVGIMLVQYIAFSKYSGSYITNYAIFMIAFIIFHFGLFLIFSLGGEYNYFYLMQYEVDTILKTIRYEFVCVEALFLAGSWINKIKPFHFWTMNEIYEYSVYKISRLFMIATGIFAFALLAMKTVAFASGYYEGVRSFDASVPSLFGMIEYFFIPFCVLTLIYSQNKQMDNVIEFFVIVWSLVTALCGDRTSGIAGILIIMLINLRFKSNEKGIRKYLISLLTLILAAFLIVFIKAFREGNAFSAMGIVSILSEVFGELGSSFFPVTLIMRVCPSRHAFLHGSSYFYSILSGFVPESLDPTGVITEWTAKSIEPLNWITIDYDYTFGTGYSLCAESYANFGYLGFIALFFIGLIIIKLLAVDNDNRFSWYTSSILMFEFFTLPRRNFYYVINHPMYCIIIISIVLLLLTRKSVSRGGGKPSQ